MLDVAGSNPAAPTEGAGGSAPSEVERPREVLDRADETRIDSDARCCPGESSSANRSSRRASDLPSFAKWRVPLNGRQLGSNPRGIERSGVRFVYPPRWVARCPESSSNGGRSPEGRDARLLIEFVYHGDRFDSGALRKQFERTARSTRVPARSPAIVFSIVWRQRPTSAASARSIRAVPKRRRSVRDALEDRSARTGAGRHGVVREQENPGDCESLSDGINTRTTPQQGRFGGERLVFPLQRPIQRSWLGRAGGASSPSGAPPVSGLRRRIRRSVS